MSTLRKSQLLHIARRFYNKDLPRIFIETGTFKGESLGEVESLFVAAHTIELDRVLYEEAVERFKFSKNIKLHLGDSVKILAELLPDIGEPAVFWLDAHYSGPGTAMGEEEVPLLEELRVIGRRKYKDIIIIDDKKSFKRKTAVTGGARYKPFVYDWRDITAEKIKESIGWKINNISIDYDADKLIILTNLCIGELLWVSAVKLLRQIKIFFKR